MVFEIPIAYITNETSTLTVDVKNFSDYDVVELKRLIKSYIDENGINSTVRGLYNDLYKKLDYPFIFKPKDKELLAGNNIHIQILPKFDKDNHMKNKNTKEEVYDESVGKVKWIGSLSIRDKIYDYGTIPHFYIVRDRDTCDIYLFRTYNQLVEKLTSGDVK